MKPRQAVVTQSVGQGQPAHSPKRNLITRAGPVRPQADPAAASRGCHPRETRERGSSVPPFHLLYLTRLVMVHGYSREAECSVVH